MNIRPHTCQNHSSGEPRQTKKTFVLDTNVLLHNPQAIYAFEDNDVVIPFVVIEEIDLQKRRQDEIGRNARVVSRDLDQLRGTGRLSDGLALPSGGRLRIEVNHQGFLPEFPQDMDAGKKDNRILAVAYHLQQQIGSEKPVFLVTKDLNLRIKADILGVSAQDFYSDKINISQLYSGVGSWNVMAEDVDAFYRDGYIKAPDSLNARSQQFYILKNPEMPSQSALARHFRRSLYPLTYGNSVSFGIRPKNKEQRFAFELLLNDDIKVATIIGRAGTGKTLLALAIGLEKVVEQKFYTRLLVTRPVVPIGNDLGYLPGTREEKLRPWMQPIYDNIEFLFGNNNQQYKIIDHLIESGVLEMEALTYIRGRSIPRQFIICDEAQNLTPHMIKTLITRVGEGTKIVFTGDPEQIDHPYLDASSNGLTYLVERLKDEEIAGHVTLIKGERSDVAEMGARLL
ncbi:MAG: PhoH family protein [Syntrophales bacterium]|nr:PhoH family protein [Syntrophales bacterium]